MAEPERRCPDCDCPLEPIAMLDQFYFMSYGELRYSFTAGARRAFPRTSGTAKGWICPECQRILLYGEPKQR